jgi:hypothetical protein
MPTSNQYEYCRCGSCVTAGGPRGLSQTSRTAKQHRANEMPAPEAHHPSKRENIDRFASADTPGDAEHLDDIFEPWMSEAHHSGMSDSDGGTSQYARVDPGFSSDSDQEYARLLPPNGEFDSLSSDEGENGDLLEDVEDIVGVEDLARDDLFVTNSMLFDIYRTGNKDGEDLDEPEDVPQGLLAHPSIRNALIRAVTSSYFHGSTHAAVQHMLEGSALLLQSAERSGSGLHYPGLSTMARTLATAERHLGLSLDGFITYYFICDACWELHHPSELYKLHSPVCGEPDCNGLLYSSKRSHDGSEKRRPMLTVPYVEPEKAIQRMLLQPGKLAQINEWRGPGDEIGKVPPVADKGYDAFPDPFQPIKDVCDGWEWRTIRAGLERRRTGEWTIEDVDVHEIHQRFVSLPCGLVWQMNIDW